MSIIRVGPQVAEQARLAHELFKRLSLTKAARIDFQKMTEVSPAEFEAAKEAIRQTGMQLTPNPHAKGRVSMLFAGHFITPAQDMREIPVANEEEPQRLSAADVEAAVEDDEELSIIECLEDYHRILLNTAQNVSGAVGQKKRAVAQLHAARVAKLIRRCKEEIEQAEDEIPGEHPIG